MDAIMVSSSNEQNAALIKLRIKCNRLIDEVDQRNMKIEQLEKENEKLKDSLKKANSNLFDSKTEKGDNKCKELIDFISQFINIIDIAVQQDLIIPFTYNSQYAKEFEKIDTQDFRKLIEKKARMDRQKFFEFCNMFRLLGRRKNGRMSVGADNTMVYMIPKHIVEYIRKSQEQEKES